MKSTGSTIEAFDDNSMPDDRNTEKEKRDKNNISKSLFYHEINNVWLLKMLTLTINHTN